VPAPQLVPHAPQFALLLRVSTHAVPQRVSLIVQFARHCPATHAVPAAQAVPQAPQFVLSVWVFAHAVPQRTVPIAQGARQRPAMQVVPAPQAVPQAPQFALSVWVFTHAVPHPVSPPVQVGVPVQLPAVHACPGRHARPQAPQWAVLVWVFTHAIPQPVSPPVQMREQVPDAHVSPAAQALLQRPQWVIEVRVSTSQPLAASPSQFAKPALQVKAHAPALQVAVALARAGQALPHDPQFAAEARVSTSQPLAALPSQSAEPVMHALPHTPAAQVGVPPAEAVQRVVHAPQVAGSVWRLRQEPSQQVSPAPQGTVMEHPVVQLPLRQMRPAPHCASWVHCTQARLAGSQRGRSEEVHDESLRQPERQVLLASQYCESKQSSSAPQPTAHWRRGSQ
jgi:hypothetical protein